MTTTELSSDHIVAKGTAFDFAAPGDTLIVDPGVHLTSQSDGYGIVDRFGGELIQNHGTIGSSRYGIYLYHGSGTTIYNYSDGTIEHSRGFVDIYSRETNTTLLNNGKLSGSVMCDYDIHVSNAGSMLEVSAKAGSTVRNTGTIGYVLGSYTEIRNTGSIATFSGAVSQVENYGTINDAVLSGGQTSAVFNNRGLVKHLDFDGLYAGSVVLRNTGTIQGDTKLTSGKDTYDGRGSTASGSVKGGYGDDVLIAGSHGDTLSGGVGHDTLYAGAGADTFVFDAYGSQSSDRIYGFDASQDTVAAAVSAFYHESGSPRLTIGTQPVGNMSQFLYNPDLGLLSYDADGTGSHAALRVTYFDNHPALTVSNLKLV